MPLRTYGGPPDERWGDEAIGREGASPGRSTTSTPPSERKERKRIRIERPKRRPEPWWLEVPPIDPRDPDILRAKSHASMSTGGRHDRGRRF